MSVIMMIIMDVIMIIMWWPDTWYTTRTVSLMLNSDTHLESHIFSRQTLSHKIKIRKGISKTFWKIFFTSVLNSLCDVNYALLKIQKIISFLPFLFWRGFFIKYRFDIYHSFFWFEVNQMLCSKAINIHYFSSLIYSPRPQFLTETKCCLYGAKGARVVVLVNFRTWLVSVPCDQNLISEMRISVSVMEVSQVKS